MTRAVIILFIFLPVISIAQQYEFTLAAASAKFFMTEEPERIRPTGHGWYAGPKPPPRDNYRIEVSVKTEGKGFYFTDPFALVCIKPDSTRLIIPFNGERYLLDTGKLHNYFFDITTTESGWMRIIPAFYDPQGNLYYRSNKVRLNDISVYLGK